MPTQRETILAALHARLSALSATALRGDVLPERARRSDGAGHGPAGHGVGHRHRIGLVLGAPALAIGIVFARPALRRTS